MNRKNQNNVNIAFSNNVKSTSLTGGSEQNTVHGGQVSAFNPQYVPGHQVVNSGQNNEPNKKKKNILSSIFSGGSGRVKGNTNRRNLVTGGNNRIQER
tara:strand:- start:536 stop:829 length:294 start_codon:yes stop_codon:yes gene_type:complete